jgi:nitrogen fixation protein NifB
VLVKVNSVLIPGVNDEHLKEVSRVVKAKGAFLHNVMPLIAEPEHGTFYGLMGQRGPSNDELQALQEACAGDMAMMRHCRQCRADAVGMLGEDRGAEFTLEKIAAMDIDYAAAMQRRAEVHAAIEANRAAQQQQRSETFVSIASLKRSSKPKPAPLAAPSARIAVASSGGGVINVHFGHAREFLIYEAAGVGEQGVGDQVDVRFLAARKVDLYCVGGDTCGEAEDALAKTIRALEGCTAVLCSKIGIEPWDRLEAAGLVPNGEHAMEPIEDAVAAVYRELLAAGRLGVEDAADAPVALSA